MPSGSKRSGVRSSIPIWWPITGTPITKEPTMYPSAGAFATSIAPGNGPPPPPGLLTTAADVPYAAWKSSAIIRVSTSSKSPGGHGTTKVTGFSGYSAIAVPANADIAIAAAPQSSFVAVIVVSLFTISVYYMNQWFFFRLTEPASFCQQKTGPTEKDT